MDTARNRKCALVTGITGQDGSYLAELLLEKGYEVHGIIRRSSSFNTARIDDIYQDPHEAEPPPDPALRRSERRVVAQPHPPHRRSGRDLQPRRAEPREGLVRHARVHRRGDRPRRRRGCSKRSASCRSARASIRPRRRRCSARSAETPQNETTPFYPRSPYGVAKVYAYWMTVNYREAYGLFAVNGILFNHESPRRGETFVSRKITRAVGRIKLGLQDRLYLGNLDAQRDWGYAKDYVEAMWLMLQQDEPDDYVIATGETHTVREFCERSLCGGRDRDRVGRDGL